MINLFTDGSCITGKKYGTGAAYCIQRDSCILDAMGTPIGKGGAFSSELMAALVGLCAVEDYVKDGESVVLHTDSRLLINGLGRCEEFARHPSGRNYAIWLEIYNVLARLQDRGCKVSASKVDGHMGNLGNMICDKLAKGAARTREIQKLEDNDARKSV